jgi:2',3'-cyclic-nucleotide 2'-phosphodiesterase (5'-nucleotidase family)
MMRGLSSVALILLFLLGCGGPPDPQQPGQPRFEAGDATVSFTQVESHLSDDPTLEGLVSPYRARMAEEIQEVIGETTGMLSKAVPEGTLGNFATDAMLWAANRALTEPVAMALTNNGGLRVPIGPGPISVGQMFELMPFENMLSVLTLSGSQVEELCHQMAEKRGEPVSGFSFRISTEDGERIAQDILIGGQPLDQAGEYRLVTNDYMASGGDSFEVLLIPVSRQDLPILLRDAFIDYVRELGTIEPRLEGRIIGGIGS